MTPIEILAIMCVLAALVSAVQVIRNGDSRSSAVLAITGFGFGLAAVLFAIDSPYSRAAGFGLIAFAILGPWIIPAREAAA